MQIGRLQFTSFFIAATLLASPLSLRADGPDHAGHDVAVAVDSGQVLNDYKPSPSGISLPDSPAAVDLLKRGASEEAQKHWENAMELYDQVLTQCPGKVVEVHPAGDAKVTRYSGIAQVVQERLAKWPEDALSTYTGQYDQPASVQLKAAAPRTTAPLLNIFWNYFATDAGKIAGIRLMDIYLEEGDFLSARWIGDRLLSFHPALAADRSAITYCTATASHFQGDDAHAQELLKQLQQSDADALGSVGGKDVPLVDSLAKLLASPRPLPTTLASDPDTYPQFGGNSGSGAVSSSSARFGPSRVVVKLTPPDYSGLTAAQLARVSASDKFAANSNFADAIIPVVDNGDLFFQDGRSIYAVDPVTGDSLPGWTKTYPKEGQGRFTVRALGRPRNQLLTVTVSPTALLAVVGQTDSLAHAGFVGKPPVSVQELVCLDRDTGRELWSRTPRDIPDASGTLSSAEYQGSPVILPAPFSPSSAPNQDSVLVIARTGTTKQFDDCYLVCLSLKSGEYLWSAYLGGATQNRTLSGGSSQITFAEGRIFVVTNLGAVASLDPSDGRIIWLNSYIHDADQPPQNPLVGTTTSLFAREPQTPAWYQNPLITSDGTVFAMPTDSRTIFAFDMNTGTELATFPTDNWDNAHQLIGVDGGSILLSSQRKAYSIDWRKWSSTGNSTDSTNWSADLGFSDDSSICGRGFATANSVFIPTAHRLVQIKNGRIRALYPSRGNLSADQQPGSLLLTARSIVIAGQNQLEIISDSSPLKN